jgi:hypothetical protein
MEPATWLRFRQTAHNQRRTWAGDSYSGIARLRIVLSSKRTQDHRQGDEQLVIETASSQRITLQQSSASVLIEDAFT